MQLPESTNPLELPGKTAGLSDDEKGLLIARQLKPLICLFHEAFSHVSDFCTPECDSKDPNVPSMKTHWHQQVREAWDATLASGTYDDIPFSERHEEASKVCHKLASVLLHWYQRHHEALITTGSITPMNTVIKHLYALAMPLGLLKKEDRSIMPLLELGKLLNRTAAPLDDNETLMCPCYGPPARFNPRK